MDKDGFTSIIFILIFVSTTCNASLVSHPRKLIGSEGNNASATSQVSPAGSPANESNTNPINTGKSQKDQQRESQMGNQSNSDTTLPNDSKGPNKHANDTKTLGALSPPADKKNGNTVDRGNGKANLTTVKLGNNASCKESMTSCRQQKMLACIKALKDGGSKDVLLVVENEGEDTMEVNVDVPNYLKNDLPAFEVPKNKTVTRRINISSTVGKSTELIVNSRSAKCVLHLVQPASVDNLIQQLTFYSKQVSPIYAMYASFLVAFLFGGTWACCRLRKRNQQDGIPYQELEMGLPESASAINVDTAEGWDHDWDDDWDEDNTVKSPSGHQVRSVSADGLVSRSSKKDGWETDWKD